MANLKINILANDKTKAALSSVQAGLGRLRSSIFSIQSALIGIGGGLAVRSLVNVGSEVENLGVRFNFLFGNVKEGTKAFNNLIGFAAKVPFSLAEISTASGNLAVVAKDADDLTRILKITGNVAAVTGLDFRQTAEQIQRAFAGGIAAADVFRERGVRALLGFEAGVQKTAAETIKAFEETFGPDGRFGKATEVLATTFTGTLSMLSDKLFKFRLETNRAGFFDFIKNALVVVNRTIETNAKAMAEFSNAVGQGLVTFIKQALLGTAALIDAIRPLFSIIGIGIGGLLDVIKGLPPGIREMGILGFLLLGRTGKIVVVGIFGLMKQMGVNLDEITNKIFGQHKAAMEMGPAFKVINEFLKKIDENIILSKEQMTKLMKELGKVQKLAKDTGISFRKIGETIGEKIRKDLESVNETIGKFILAGVQNFSRALAEAVVLGKQLNSSMKELAQKLLVDMVAFTIQLIIQRKIEAILVNMGIIKEREKLNLIKNQTSELKKQAAIKAVSAMFGIPMFAKGGAVSKGRPVIVGERGPELFVPNQTGQITQNARGLGGQGAVVNFNITTLDASGFEDMLVRSRGTISNIINQSLNEKGVTNLV